MMIVTSWKSSRYMHTCFFIFHVCCIMNLEINVMPVFALCKVRGRSQSTLATFWLFLTTYPPSVDIFSLVKIDEKSTFFDYLPPSSCKCSLWMAPNWASCSISNSLTIDLNNIWLLFILNSLYKLFKLGKILFFELRTIFIKTGT